jgi:hypothetical protein
MSRQRLERLIVPSVRWEIGGGRLDAENGSRGGASQTEEGTLVAGVGVPGEEVGLVSLGEVGDNARGSRDAMGGKEDGSGIGNDKGGRGRKHGGTVAKVTKAGRKLEKALGIGGEGGAGEFFLKNSKVVSLRAVVKGEVQRWGSKVSVGEAWE